MLRRISDSPKTHAYVPISDAVRYVCFRYRLIDMGGSRLGTWRELSTALLRLLVYRVRSRSIAVLNRSAAAVPVWLLVSALLVAGCNSTGTDSSSTLPTTISSTSVTSGSPATGPSTPSTTLDTEAPSAWSDLPALTELTNSFVYLSDDSALVVVNIDAGTASSHRLEELAPGDPPYRLVRRGDLLAFYGATGNATESGSRAPAVFTIDPRSSIEPNLLAESWFFIPSANEDRLWLALLNEQSPETVRALSGIEEISVDGTVTVDRVPTPGGRWPVAAVRDGLLFETTDALELWDPISQTLLGSVPGPFAVAIWENRIASCTLCTDLHLIDLDAGTDRIVNPTDEWFGFFGFDGAFSPDGRLVAVSVFDRRGPWTADTMFGIALIDFEAGTATTIPGSQFHGGLPADLSWNSDGQWLFANTAEEILAYQPGDDTAYRIPVELEAGFYGRFFGMAAD